MSYTKQNFEDGKTLYASQLEAIEDGILEAQQITEENIPYIGENGNWWIGQNDTGKPSEGVSVVGASVIQTDL